MSVWEHVCMVGCYISVGMLSFLDHHPMIAWLTLSLLLFTKTIKKGDSFHMGYLGRNICERMLSWEFSNFLSYMYPPLINLSNINFVFFGNIYEWNNYIKSVYMHQKSFTITNKYFSLNKKTTHLRVIIHLNIYIIVRNNELCSISFRTKICV